MLRSWLRADGDDSAVQELLQRVQEVLLPQDQLVALQSLANVLTGWPAREAFCSLGGFAVLKDVLESGLDDVELTRAALECLVACLPPADAAGDRASSEAAARNAVQLLRTPNLLSLVLALLSAQQELQPEQQKAAALDFYCRFHAAQLLRALAAAQPMQVAEAVLAAPSAVAHLLGLLEEPQEALRCEAVLVLHLLSQASHQVQHLASLQGGFDRLFAILREERFLEGGVLVHDCLELLASLLRGNPSSQLLFLEMGHLGQLLASVQQLTAALQAQGGRIEQQVGINLAALLEVLVVLLAHQPGDERGSSSSSSAPAVQAHRLVLQHDMLSSLPLIAFSLPAAHVSALRCLAALLKEGDSSRLKAELLQLQLPQLQQQFGGGFMAAVAISLGQAVTTPQGLQPPSLHYAAGYLELLVVWLAGHGPAATAFLRSVSRRPFLVDAIRGSNACSGALASKHPATRGLLCLLLGLCALHAEDGTGDTPSRAQLANAMAQQIGVQAAIAALDGMLAAAAAGESGLARARMGQQARAGAGPEVSLIPGLAAWLAVACLPVKQMLQPDAGGPGQAAQQQQQQQPPSPAQQQQQLPSQPAVLPAAAQQPSSPARSASVAGGALHTSRAGTPSSLASPTRSSTPATDGHFHQQQLAALQQQLQAAHDRIAALQLEASQAAAAQQTAAQAEAEAEAAADKLRHEAAKLEAELADLSAAYSQLEHHTNGLQARLEELEQQRARQEQEQQRRVAAAAEEARAAAQQEADEAMADLLVCLGEERHKAEVLGRALAEMGVDVGQLLAV